MTSSSATRSGLFAALLLVGCAEQPIEETQTLVVAESAACALARDAGVEVNHYRAVLMAFGGFDETSGDSPCIDCIRTGRCLPVQTQCGCTPAHPPQTGFVNRQLDGLRFTDVTPGIRYCIGLFGLDDSEAMPVERSESCDCVDPSVTAPMTMCGVSPFPGLIEENAGAIFISVDCRPGCPAIFGP